MPAKKTTLTDAERAKRMRDLARETGADNDPATLDKALRKLGEHRKGAPQSFVAGWVDGWKSICGPTAEVPSPSNASVPDGFEPYRYGYEQGRAVAAGK